MSIVNDYNAHVEQMFSMIRANEDLNRSLIQLRDAVLPKLMSGELDVSEIEF